MVAGARKNVCNVVIGQAQNTGPADIFRSGEIPVRRAFSYPKGKNRSEGKTPIRRIEPNSEMLI